MKDFLRFFGIMAGIYCTFIATMLAGIYLHPAAGMAVIGIAIIAELAILDREDKK